MNKQKPFDIPSRTYKAYNQIMLIRNKTNEVKKMLDDVGQDGLEKTSIAVAIFSAIMLLILAAEIIFKVYKRFQVAHENHQRSEG